MRTQETDRNGNVKQYDYNRLGYPLVIREFTRGLRKTDPPVYITTMSYNADGRVLEKTLPQGNITQYTYDDGNPERFSEGNMLRKTELPDAVRGGDQKFITTTYTYEPAFNHIVTMTDPRGNDPSFIPPNGGSNSPARYTTTYTYDANGNLLERQQPTVHLPNNQLQQILTNYTYNQFGQPTSETDPEGNVTEYFYYPMNDKNNLTGGYLKERIVDATTSTRRTEKSPPASITTQYFYDGAGNVIRIIDGRGNDRLFSVNQLNQIVENQSEAPFRYVTYTFYDANDNTVQRTIENRVPVESDAKAIFTSNGNFETQDSNPQFFLNKYTLDILDKLVKQDLDATGSNPPRVITQYQYDPNENRTRITYPVGNITTFAYDERDLLFMATRGFGTNDASTITYDYDLNRNLALMIDGRGFTTTYQYDGFDRRVGVTDAIGDQTTTHYDPVSNDVADLRYGQAGGSNNGNVLLSNRTYEHDEMNRLYQYDEKPINGSSFVALGVTTQRPPSITTGPLNPGSISSLTLYDRNGRTVQVVEDDLTTTTYAYDGVNRNVMRTDPQGDTTVYTYDANSNVVASVDIDISQKTGVASETFTTTYTYDSHNRQTIVTDNCGNTRRAAFDSRNNLTDRSDAKADATSGCPGAVNAQGNSMRYAYDGLSRRLQSIQDLGVGGVGSGSIDTTNPFNPSGRITTRSTYDANSRLSALTDNNGNTTQYSYDALDRRTAEVLADGTSSTFTYDPDDDVLSVTDNNGSVQANTYDAIDRRAQTTVKTAAGVIGTTQNTYQYDGLSRMTQMTDNNDPSDQTSFSTVASAYDSLGRMIEESQNGKAVDGAWFAQAQRTALTYPNNRQENYTYDSLERIQTIKDNGANTNLAQYSYVGRYRVLQRQLQNGTQLTYLDNSGTIDIGYDPLRRTIQRRDLHTNDNSLIVGFEHSYDRENNKNDETKLHSQINSELYGYDSSYRITQFQRGPQNATRTQDWTLDGVGNWRINTVNGFAENRAVNNTNEYTSIQTSGLTYDRNGNLTSALGVGYEWDYKNRLRQVCSLPTGATSCTAQGSLLLATYSYDAVNRRTRKVVTNSGSLNGTSSFYYDAWRGIEERGAADTPTQQYVFGSRDDEPIVFDRANGQRFFYHQDTLNSTFALTDITGAIQEGYQYDAYGQQTVLAGDFTTILGTVSTVGNPYMFTGQRFDPETGLLYYRSRYYDPGKGRFLQRDPAGYVDGMNLYQYVDDRPTMFDDPLGLKKYSGKGKISGFSGRWLVTIKFEWEMECSCDALSRATCDNPKITKQEGVPSSTGAGVGIPLPFGIGIGVGVSSSSSLVADFKFTTNPCPDQDDKAIVGQWVDMFVTVKWKKQGAVNVGVNVPGGGASKDVSSTEDEYKSADPSEIKHVCCTCPPDRTDKQNDKGKSPPPKPKEEPKPKLKQPKDDAPPNWGPGPVSGMLGPPGDKK